MSELLLRLDRDRVVAMKQKETARRDVLQFLRAALKQIEVNERRTLSDADVLSVIEKLLKQQQESLQQAKALASDERVQSIEFEISILKAYMPEPLDEASLASEIDRALTDAAASSLKDMGRVMALLKERISGRADFQQVSAQVRARLSSE